MLKTIDLENWNRREHFEFFRQYDDPFWGIVSDVDCTAAYENAGQTGNSFFLLYLYKTLQAINQIEAFRYRILDDKVVCYDKINVSSTIGRKDGTFAFSSIDFDNDFEVFKQSAKKEIRAVQNSTGLRLSEDAQRNDTIHFSAIPWISFSSLSHARNYKIVDSVPKICFGKMRTEKAKKIIPVSLHAHHGLADGYHGGLFFDLLQKLMNEG
ncbi:MAG: CatA-like O-acetyltransferase [Fidelibacterota bacterium]